MKNKYIPTAAGLYLNYLIHGKNAYNGTERTLRWQNF